MFVENIGVPLPTVAAYIAAGVLIERGQSYAVVFLVLTAGHVLGSITAYFLGRLGDNWRMRKMKDNPKLNHVHSILEDWYDRYGAFTIFITRFIGYIRPWSSFVAGFAGVNLATFVIWTVLGTLVFNAILLEANRYLIRYLERWNDSWLFLSIVVLSLVFLIAMPVFLAFAQKWAKKAKKEEPGDEDR